MHNKGKFIRLLLLLLLFMKASSQQEANEEANEPTGSGGEENTDSEQAQKLSVPAFVPSASYIALDGLTLVIIFDKPVNLATLIESVESRVENGLSDGRLIGSQFQANQSREFFEKCPANGKANELFESDQITEQLVQGIQLCAKLLTRKTLKLLHKFKLHSCLWTSRVQFLIKLSRPIPASESKLLIAFQANSLQLLHQGIGEAESSENNQEEELSIELSKLPLESLGVSLAPRLVLIGPNQIPPCGQFSLSAHLSSPYGTSPPEALRLDWSVGLVGGSLINNNNNSSSNFAELSENKWKSLQQLVSSTRGNNLILDARFFNQLPQLYEFKLSATFATSLTKVQLNATHQISKIDFEAPIGTVYGSHLLGQQQLINSNQEVVLLADVQVPECASNVKQVGLYWQVSDPRVRFEQTYAPYYLAKPNSLPEQSNIEFRLNSFYGIRVKKFASSGSVIQTGDSVLDATISDGLLVMSLEPTSSLASDDLVLFASVNKSESDKYTYQWSCFDGKTAQPCYRNSKAASKSQIGGEQQVNSTRYELNQPLRPDQLPAPGGNATGSGLLLVDKTKQRQPILKIPLSWLEPEAQLWFGLQRFDRLMPSQQSKTEYALVSVAASRESSEGERGPVLTIGPILIGAGRHRASVRNPLTGAVLLPADSASVIVGRLGPSKRIKSFAWHSPNYIQPLHWTSRSTTNPLTGEEELETELHLDERLQVAHAHLQINLVACTTTSSGTISASLNLDIVEGVTECRLEVQASKVSNSLVVSLDYCNIPLGLSPMSYQLYAIDEQPSDRLVEASRQSDSSLLEDLNEADEVHLADLARPLTVPQLSPVFRFSELSLQGLLAGSSSSQKQLLRFAGRVCNRLQACRMFHSSPIRLAQLLAQLRPESSNKSLEVGPRTQLQSLQSQLESGKRANLAGSSIAAVSILNGALELARKLLVPVASSKLINNSPARSQGNAAELAEVESKTRELLPVILRDSLHYGYQSTQRQFHYTEPGQTSLGLQTMANILSFSQANIEQKFRALRLIALINRRSIMEELNLKSNCLADWRTLQATFEAVFGTFSHYHIQEQPSSGNNLPDNKHNPNKHAKQSQLATSPSSLNPFNGISMAISNSSSSLFGGRPSHQTGGKADIVMSMAPPAPAQALHSTTNGNKANRRRREEAILTYLRSVRQAFRSLISSAAIQLPLGSSRLLLYSSKPADQLADSKLSTSRSRPINFNADNNNNNNIGVNQTDKEATRNENQMKTTTTTSSDIIARLNHLAPNDLSQMFNRPVELNLELFGSITIRFNENIAAKLRRQLEEGGGLLRCRNDTTTKCRSLVLSITTFAGKAPFRSLDETASLRAPILEVGLLSPIDGSNLLDLLPSSSSSPSSFTSSSFTSSADSPPSTGIPNEPLKAQDFTIYVTFHVPQTTSSATNNQQTISDRDDFKCYRFDEEANEWQISSLQPVAASTDSSNSNADKAFRPLSCTFNSLGAFGLFRNKPPTSESSLSLPLGFLIVISLVALLSLLGCLASNSKRRSSQRAESSGTGSSSNVNTSEEDDELESNSRRKNSRIHPEQSYRNDFNYPL